MVGPKYWLFQWEVVHPKSLNYRKNHYKFIENKQFSPISTLFLEIRGGYTETMLCLNLKSVSREALFLAFLTAISR